MNYYCWFCGQNVETQLVLILQAWQVALANNYHLLKEQKKASKEPASKKPASKEPALELYDLSEAQSYGPNLVHMGWNFDWSSKNFWSST